MLLQENDRVYRNVYLDRDAELTAATRAVAACRILGEIAA